MIKCPRCTGLLVTQYEETRCLNCGWYFVEVVSLAEDDEPGAKQYGAKTGAQLPKGPR